MTDATQNDQTQTLPPAPQPAMPPRIGAPAPSQPPAIDAAALGRLIAEKVEEKVRERLKGIEEAELSKSEVTGEDQQFAQFDKKLDVFGVDLSESLPSFHLHWFNDDGDRIVRMQLLGYTFVARNEIALNEKVSPLNQDLGDNIAVYAGTRVDGSPLRTYLMKIPKPVYEKRQKAIQAKNDQIDQAIRRGAIGDALGQGGYAGTDRGGVSISVSSRSPKAA